MTYTIEKRAQAGIDFLNAEIPGWEDRIDLSRLSMASWKHCLGGQLCGGYAVFSDTVALQTRDPLTIAAFNPDSGVPGENEALTAEYVRRIAERRRERLTLKPALLAV